MYLRGEKISRIEGKGHGWVAWCDYCKRLGIPPLIHVDITYVSGTSVSVSWEGRRIGTTWRVENFSPYLKPKPLTDYM